MGMTGEFSFCRITERDSAISEAYLDTRKSLRRFIGKFGANASEVEDIAQEALACAMKAESDRPIENPKAYLFRVARNLALRHRVPRGAGVIEEIESEALAEIPADMPSIEDQIISRERLALLANALETLPPMCRRVFLMRKVYGYSHQETADRLGISVSTVEKHLGKGFARCLAFMQSREHDPASFAIAAE